MSILTVDRALVGAQNNPILARDGLPEVRPGASPMEPHGKDYFAASGNAVGKATANTVDTIMKVVKSPEASIAAIATATGIIVVSAVGLITAGPKGALQGA